MVRETCQQVGLTGERTPVLGGTSEEKRIRLIGELLCKGILCSSGLRSQVACTDTPASTVCTPAERIVDFLRRHQSASPAEIRAILSLTRSGTYRALQRLLETGQIVSNGGRTPAAAYRLVDPTRN